MTLETKTDDWYTTARKEFMLDLWFGAEVSPEDAERVYTYLSNVGLIDYDIEKEYLWENYVEEE